MAVYDIDGDEWTELGPWNDSAMLLRLVDDDAVFFIDLAERSLVPIALG